jgi:uncharacterized membrane protein
LRALPQEARQVVRAQVREGRRGRPDTEDMLALLRIEPFDRIAAGVLLEAQRAEGLARQTVISTAWLEQIATMSVAQRAAYADRLEELSERRSKPRSKPRD